MRVYRRFSNGFTLIELLIAVAIVGILAALAYPAYVSQIEKGRRAECRSGLLKTMQQQERYFTQFNAYASFVSGTTTAPISAYTGDSPSQSSCLISAQVCDGQTLSACVELTATPTRADSQIAKLHYNSQNLKQCELAGTSTKISDTKICWP